MEHFLYPTPFSNGIAVKTGDHGAFSVYCRFSGFVRGLPGEVPHLITFQPTFDQGSLLTIVSIAATFV